jgi:hypothetical protein
LPLEIVFRFVRSFPGPRFSQHIAVFYCAPGFTIVQKKHRSLVSSAQT